MSSPIVRLVDRTDVDLGVVSFETFDTGMVGRRVDADDTATVYEGHQYSMQLVSAAGIEAEEALVSVNSGEGMHARLAQVHISGEPRNVYSVNFTSLSARDGDGCHLFWLTYGFARIRITLSNGLDFTTRDVLCQRRDWVGNDGVEKMLAKILDADGRTAAGWMFADGVGGRGGYSVIDGVHGASQSRSLASYLALVESILRDYDKLYPFFRSKARSTVVRENVRRTGLEARLFGAREFQWVMKNGEVLSPTEAETGIYDGESYYFPSYVQTQQRQRSYDTEENRIVLGFLELLARALSNLYRELSSRVESSRLRVGRLQRLKRDGHCLPALVVMEECVRRENGFALRADVLRRSAQSLLTRYRRAIPGVKALSSFESRPRRDKAFQEVMAYSLLYKDIERWWEFRGFTIAREDMALHVLRLDKLYEYYVLFTLLEWLSDNGFALDSDDGDAVMTSGYTLEGEDRYYRNDMRVNGIYRLRRENLRIAIYYQPVIYGDSREEHGIRLHRLSSRSPFGVDAFDAYYTPDFLIILRDVADGQAVTVVLDAKYSRFETLSSREGSRWSRFNEVLFKYKTDVAGPGMRPVDAVWLLSGAERNTGYVEYGGSSWARAQAGHVPSGMIAHTPELSCLGKLFEAIGVPSVDSMGSDKPALVPSADVPATEDTTVEPSTPDIVPEAVTLPAEPVGTTGERTVTERAGEGTAPNPPIRRRRARKIDVGDEPFRLVGELVTSVAKTKDFFYGRSIISKTLTGQQAPLLAWDLGELPKKMRAKYKKIEYAGFGEVYVWGEWNPVRLDKLRARVRRK